MTLKLTDDIYDLVRDIGNNWNDYADLVRLFFGDVSINSWREISSTSDKIDFIQYVIKYGDTGIVNEVTYEDIARVPFDDN